MSSTQQASTQASPSIGDLIKMYADADAALDAVEAQAKKLRETRDAVKLGIKITMKESGVDRTSAHGLTVSLREKWRAKYTPELWDSVVKWAMDTGHLQVVQRRITDAAVMELVDNGVPLPEGLSVDSYEDLDVRRTK